MPNWCTNYLRINKDKADKYVLKDDKVDFNKLIPEPESYSKTTSPLRGEDVYCYLTEKGTIDLTDEIKNQYKDIFGWRDGIDTMADEYQRFLNEEKHYDVDWSSKTPKCVEITKEEAIQKAYDTGKINCENYKRYGYPDWYEWRYANWGVKWNANTIDLADWDEDKYEIIFNTPWGPPEGWMIKLATLSDFEGDYEIEGGFEARGTFEAKNSKISWEDLEPYDWEEYMYPEDESKPFYIYDYNKAKESGLIINPFEIVDEDKFNRGVNDAS